MLVAAASPQGDRLGHRPGLGPPAFVLSMSSAMRALTRAGSGMGARVAAEQGEVNLADGWAGSENIDASPVRANR